MIAIAISVYRLFSFLSGMSKTDELSGDGLNDVTGAGAVALQFLTSLDFWVGYDLVNV
jgi:hypothetical protein